MKTKTNNKGGKFGLAEASRHQCGWQRATGVVKRTPRHTYTPAPFSQVEAGGDLLSCTPTHIHTHTLIDTQEKSHIH